VLENFEARSLHMAASVARPKMSARGVTEAIRRAGHVENLPIIDGPSLDKFAPRALADALDQEIARALEIGWTKISIHMDLRDARSLSLFLRKR